MSESFFYIGLSTHHGATHPHPSPIYHAISYFSVLLGIAFEINLCQASWHSATTSLAYFLFFASPEKANLFSGLPSGIL
jgi:hypothetical protein